MIWCTLSSFYFQVFQSFKNSTKKYPSPLFRFTDFLPFATFAVSFSLSLYIYKYRYIYMYKIYISISVLTYSCNYYIATVQLSNSGSLALV